MEKGNNAWILPDLINFPGHEEKDERLKFFILMWSMRPNGKCTPFHLLY